MATPSMKQQTFRLLRKNLCVVKPEFCDKEVILCPICSCEVTEEDVTKRGYFEHIIPENVIKADPAILREAESGPTTDQRCGITVLCRSKRTCRSNGKLLKDGCNGFKGGAYDRLFKGLFDLKNHNSSDISHRHRVAMLVMAFLGAFQRFQYSYALSEDLASVREQFDYPADQKTEWISTAAYEFDPGRLQPVTPLEKGFLPFFFTPDYPRKGVMTVTFRRCSVQLPNPSPDCITDSSLEMLLRQQTADSVA